VDRRLWGKIRYGSMYGEFEAVHIGGETTGGVPFPGSNIRKKASINGAVVRGGWLTEKWDAILELGHSSGDDDLGDLKFKQRALHPDYNVGLILFEEVVRERAARAFGTDLVMATSPDGARGFMPNGGVINSNYLLAKGRFRPGFGGFEFVGQTLVAFVDEFSFTTPNVFVCPLGDVEGTPGNLSCKTSKLLGTEFDLAIKSRFAQDLIDFSLEMGYLKFGDILKTTSRTARKIDDPESGAFSIQARVAFVW